MAKKRPPCLRDKDAVNDVSSGVLQYVLGISQTTLSRYVRGGVIRQLPGPQGHYNLADCVKAVLGHRTSESGVGDRSLKTQQEVRKLKLLNDEREGRLIDTGDASAVFSEYSSAVRAGVTALPGRLASEVAGLSNPAEIRKLIHGEVTELLNAAEEILGGLSSLAEAADDNGSGVADPEGPSEPDDSAVGRRKPNSTKGRSRARKVAK